MNNKILPPHEKYQAGLEKAKIIYGTRAEGEHKMTPGLDCHSIVFSRQIAKPGNIADYILWYRGGAIMSRV